MKLPQTSWLESFEETCQDILEDAFLLDALSVYLFCDKPLLHDGQAEQIPMVLHRLSGYLSQHALELRRLEKRLEPAES